MALSTYNPAKIRPFPGDVFLFAHPVANPGSDTTPINVVKGYFGLMYLDGQKKAALLNGTIKPWGILKSDGLSVDPKYKVLEVDTNQPIPHIQAGFFPESVEVDLTIADPSRDKLLEILSGLAGHKLDTVSGTGQPGQAGLMMGAQTYFTPYTLIFRSPSPLGGGTYDHFLVPKGVFDPGAIKLEFSKTKLWELKLKLKPQGDDWLQDAGSSIPVWGYYEETTALGS
jgi:hypothetical protein